MFCPRCSRQQISDDVRFCSRCGFQLNVVKALLADDGASFSKTSESNAYNRLRRKKDMITGAALMCVFALHTAWTTEDLSLEREYTSLIVKCFILCALINIAPVICDFFSRSDSPPRMRSRLTARFKTEEQTSPLPEADGRPTAGYFTVGRTTAEIVAPPSVTERTTKLLRDD